MPTAKQDRLITAAASSDPDAAPLTRSQLKAMQPLRQLRGRPKAAITKQLVSVRYSADVLQYFKSTGQGWQSRMNEVLSRHVSRQSKRAASTS
ncbi:MAG: BrnA antitoxin family protein [Brachymonas sp.]|nr:BrnA antitoxin family protein [Brachymonas sp.]